MQRFCFMAFCVALAFAASPVFARTAKTCPDCNCIWTDAAGAKSEKPVETLIPKADEKNAFNYYYPIKSDPDKPCKNKGLTKCECRIIVRWSWMDGTAKRYRDQVVMGGAGEHSFRKGRFEKLEKEAAEKKKGETIELLPACAMLDKDGDPEYGDAHE